MKKLDRLLQLHILNTHGSVLTIKRHHEFKSLKSEIELIIDKHNNSQKNKYDELWDNWFILRQEVEKLREFKKKHDVRFNSIKMVKEQKQEIEELQHHIDKLLGKFEDKKE